MNFKDSVTGIYEPELMELFIRLNREYFSDSLPLPNALAWDFRPSNRRGGQISYSSVKFQVHYIVVRGWQKDNPEMVELTMLHEMVHLSLVKTFFDTGMNELGYRTKDFCYDKAGAFIMECAKVASKFGCSFNDLAYWDTEVDDNDSSLTSARYASLAKAKSLLATLSEDD